MDVNSVALIVTEDKIATPATGTLHMAIAAIFHELAQTDIPMEELQPFISNRSCEVLINLMTRHIIRFLDENNRAPSYHRLFGRSHVLENLRRTPKGNMERAEQAVREYCKSLKTLCGFKYVAEAVIFEPNKESVRYFLVYATNDYHGIEVFKQAEMTAADLQGFVRHETRIHRTSQEEFLFGDQAPKSPVTVKLRQRYETRAQNKVIETLLKNTDLRGVEYEEVYCEAMAFPLKKQSQCKIWQAGNERRILKRNHLCEHV